MKKRNIMKIFAALALSAVAATSCFAMAACKDNKDNDKDTDTDVPAPATHTHQWATTDWTKDNTGHWHECLADGCDVTDNTLKGSYAVHNTNGTNGACSVCGHGGTTTTPENPTPENPTPETPTPVAHTYTYSYAAITTVGGETPTDKGTLTQADFTGDNSFLTLGSGKVTYRNKDLSSDGKSPDAIEIASEGFTVTFQGTGTISIKFASTGGSNVSGFVLLDSTGAYLEAETVDEAITKLEEDVVIHDDAEYTNKAGLYTITGTTDKEITFEITTAGTYTLYSRYCYYNDSKSENQSRGCRITAISMVDNYADAE